MVNNQQQIIRKVLFMTNTYSVGWGITVYLDRDPVPAVSAPVKVEKANGDFVTFCGQEFCPRSLLGVSLNGNPPAELVEFKALVEELDKNAMIAWSVNCKQSAPSFVGFGKSLNFIKALDRLAGHTSWQLLFSPSQVNAGEGVNVSVILPD